MRDDGLIGHQVSLDRKLGLLASAQQGLTGVNSTINVLAEQYPTLYSYASMQHFQQDIFDAEEHLQAARQLYNSNVSLYNQRINTFPYLLLAKLYGMKETKFYTVEEKKKDCYGENTGVLALSKIYDPLVIRIAAVLAIILSFSPKFEAVINTIPTGIIGGISFVLYGMISAIGVRNVVENRVDFTNSRNLIIAAVILVSALGFNSVGGLTFAVAGVSINLSGLAIAAIVGILLNAILPGNDYEFDSADGADAPSSGNLQV